MNPRTTGILLLVALALGAFVWLTVIEGEEGRRESEALAKRLFPEIESEDVLWLALTTTDGREVRAERSGDGWRITAPFDFPGDDFALDGVASALAQVQSEAVYEEPQPLAVYGLDDPGREIRFGVGDAEHALRVGDTTPIGASAYAHVGGRAAVYTIPSFRTNALRKAFEDLRDKRVLTFDADGVGRLEASWPDGRVTLVKEEGDWRLVEPLEARADARTVDELLSDLSFLRARGFEDEPPAPAEAGLDAPGFSVTLTLDPAEEGGEPRRLRLAIGSATVDGDALVQAGRPTLYRIAPERLEDLPRDLADYRYKQLADFALRDAGRLELVFANPDGEPVRIEARLEGDAWQSEPEPLDAAKAARLVDELSQLRADTILADGVGPDELAGLGLDPPNAALLVYGAVEEGGEEQTLAEIRIGTLRGGDTIVAQSALDPAVYGLDPALAEHLPVSLEAFRNRFQRGEDASDEEPPPLGDEEELL